MVEFYGAKIGGAQCGECTGHAYLKAKASAIVVAVGSGVMAESDFQRPLLTDSRADGAAAMGFSDYKFLKPTAGVSEADVEVCEIRLTTAGHGSLRFFRGPNQPDRVHIGPVAQRCNPTPAYLPLAWFFCCYLVATVATCLYGSGSQIGVPNLSWTS